MYGHVHVYIYIVCIDVYVFVCVCVHVHVYTYRYLLLVCSSKKVDELKNYLQIFCVVIYYVWLLTAVTPVAVQHVAVSIYHLAASLSMFSHLLT